MRLKMRLIKNFDTLVESSSSFSEGRSKSVEMFPENKIIATALDTRLTGKNYVLIFCVPPRLLLETVQN